MKKLYIIALSVGQNVLSSDSQEKPMFPKSWYEKQLKYIMPSVCAQKCPGQKESCMSECFMDYSQQIEFYTIRQAIKECSEDHQLDESFEYVDMEKNPGKHIKKVTKPFIRSMELMNYSHIKQCVDSKMKSENDFLLKMLKNSQTEVSNFETKHPILTKSVKIKTCLNEFEIKQPLASTTEMLKCFKNKFFDKK